ncbi:hypothetical protein Esti_004033 [Eimeria stiedai]
MSLPRVVMTINRNPKRGRRGDVRAADIGVQPSWRTTRLVGTPAECRRERHVAASCGYDHKRIIKDMVGRNLDFILCPASGDQMYKKYITVHDARTQLKQKTEWPRSKQLPGSPLMVVQPRLKGPLPLCLLLSLRATAAAQQQDLNHLVISYRAVPVLCGEEAGLAAPLVYSSVAGGKVIKAKERRRFCLRRPARKGDRINKSLHAIIDSSGEPEDHYSQISTPPDMSRQSMGETRLRISAPVSCVCKSFYKQMTFVMPAAAALVSSTRVGTCQESSTSAVAMRSTVMHILSCWLVLSLFAGSGDVVGFEVDYVLDVDVGTSTQAVAQGSSKRSSVLSALFAFSAALVVAFLMIQCFRSVAVGHSSTVAARRLAGPEGEGIDLFCEEVSGVSEETRLRNSLLMHLHERKLMCGVLFTRHVVYAHEANLKTINAGRICPRIN